MLGKDFLAQGNIYVPGITFSHKDEKTIDSLLILSEKYSQRAVEASIKNAQEALALSLRYNLSRKEGFAEYFLGKGIKGNGQVMEGKMHYENALTAFRKSGDSLLVALVLDKIGYIYREMGDYSKALDFHLNGLELRQKFNDTPLNQAYSFASVGGIYRELEDYETALFYFQDAFKIRTAQKDTLGMGHSNVGIGLVHEKMQNWDKALARYHEGLKLYENINFYQFVINTNRLIGGIYTKKEDFVNAKKYLENAILIAKRTKKHWRTS